ncbi:MAG: NfeD family protein [Proteobacteria bacterium]|nr:NfeD family protein [Pseudomonadota bacterium]HQR02491.1 NfeD family protein [Rhodocyclaceae bacterium]
MNFDPYWWHWAVAGIALILLELVIPAFVMIWFGLGALFVALLLAFVPIGFTTQLGLWLTASVVLTAFWFKVFKPGQLKTRIGASDPHVIGEVGLLGRGVAPFERGEVRFQKPILGGEVWPCIADDTISAGERVRVVAIEGSLLRVARVH